MQDDKDKLTLEKRVNGALDDSIEELSFEVQQRLTQMRKVATAPKAQIRWINYAASWKTATAVLLIVSLSWNFLSPQDEKLSIEVADITPFAELLQEDLEMLDELEFVYWMAEESDSESETATL